MLSASLPAEIQSPAASTVLDSTYKKMLGKSHTITRLNSLEPTYDIVSDMAAFDALKTDWDQLHASNNSHQLCFQSHAWINAWLETYTHQFSQSGDTIAIITTRTNGRLRLVCPMLLRRKRAMKQLTWLGEPASQYGDVITDGSKAACQLITNTLDYAIQRLKPDIVHLRKVRDDAAISTWLKPADAICAQNDEAPFLDFSTPKSIEHYCAKYSSKSRKNRRRLRRRMAEAGSVTTTVLPAGEAARDVIRLGLDFKQKWLIDRGHVSSALRDKSMRPFLGSVINQSDNQCRAFVSIMHCDETPISVQFGIVTNRRLALHMIAYNPATEKSGAGVLHIEDTIQHCIENGHQELDFLAPNATYKQAWADATTSVTDYVSARTIKGRLYAQAYLRHTRNLLKSTILNLPLGVRQSIAKHIQR
jgi:CelD/BcsL family acetyltransferase involved in cellulose biosynthesis